MEITIVRPVDALGDDYLDRDAADRFAELKGRTLGYVEASINTPGAPGQFFSSRAPLGAVCNQEDAERLIMALGTEFPENQLPSRTTTIPKRRGSDMASRSLTASRNKRGEQLVERERRTTSALK